MNQATLASLSVPFFVLWTSPALADAEVPDAILGAAPQRRASASLNETESTKAESDVAKDEVLIIDDEEDDDDDEILLIFDDEDRQKDAEDGSSLETMSLRWMGGETRFSGRVDGLLSFDTRNDPSREDVLEWWNTASLRIDHRVSENLRAVVEGRARLGVVAEDAPANQSYYVFNASASKWAYDVELREAYVDLKFDPFHVRLGQQIFVFGKNETAAAADVLNPLDLRYHQLSILQSAKSLKRGILAADLSWRHAFGAIDLIWAPLFLGQQASVFGRDFSVFAPGSLESDSFRDNLNIDTSIEDDVQTLSATDVPEPFLASQVALRATFSKWGWDFAATAYYGFDPTPSLKVDPEVLILFDRAPEWSADATLLFSDTELRSAVVSAQQKAALGVPLVEARYERMAQFALEGEGVVGPIIMRFDVGGAPKRSYYIEDGEGLAELRRLPTVQAALGAEYTYGEYLFVSASFQSTVVFDVPNTGYVLGLENATENTAREVAASYGVSAVLQGSYPDLNLQASLSLLYNISPGDIVLGGELSWSPSDGHTVAGGALYIDGPRGSIAGRFKRNDMVFLRYRYAF